MSEVSSVVRQNVQQQVPHGIFPAMFANPQNVTGYVLSILRAETMLGLWDRCLIITPRRAESGGPADRKCSW